MFGKPKMLFVVGEMARQLSFVVVTSFIGVAIIASCTGVQRKAIVDASVVACIEIAEKSGDPTAKTVCATAEELAPFVKVILGKRAMASASTSTSASAPPAKQTPAPSASASHSAK